MYLLTFSGQAHDLAVLATTWKLSTSSVDHVLDGATDSLDSLDERTDGSRLGLRFYTHRIHFRKSSAEIYKMSHNRLNYKWSEFRMTLSVILVTVILMQAKLSVTLV